MIPKNKLLRFKDNLLKNCDNHSYEDGCDAASCKCLLKVSRAEKYISSGIPPSYWNMSIKNFSGDKKFKKIVSDIAIDIDAFYDKGRSIAFTGGLGTGKTYMACAILKLAIISNYSASYTTMAEIINSTLSHDVDSSTYIKSLLNYDFLVIDEFDSRWIFPSEKSEQVFGSSLEYILRTRFQNETPTILCSNCPDMDKILSGNFGKAFRSLRSRHMDIFCVGGKDFRRGGGSNG